MTRLRLNKRTALGWQLWRIGAMIALVPSDVPLAVPLIAAGSYLVLGPARSSPRSEARRHRRYHIL